MNTLKKAVFYISLLLLLFTFSGCIDYTGMVKLPDLEGMSQAEISAVLDELELTYGFRIEPRVYHSEEEFDKFIKYGNNLRAGKYVYPDEYIPIYTTALPLTVNRLDEVTLEIDVTGLSFVNDGIGEVTLIHPTDGDTAQFRDKITGESLYVRFLGVDTPEVFSQKEPWGSAASAFTASALNNAKTIVLESEGNRRDTYDRYLAWVWLDGKLHNLDLVQQAYSNAKVARSSKYFDIFNEVEALVAKTGRRVFGELDPTFNYN
ncbi:MAG TPA: thermonuclease family protein [Acholeplasmataceae bacterium]|jgi:endonuclease YncB( thermonuclease family)|nr:thermonuclease family protein [Acholeplasmataceae bacterium]